MEMLYAARGVVLDSRNLDGSLSRCDSSDHDVKLTPLEFPPYDIIY